MEAYAYALSIAIPFFIFLIIIEAVAAYFMGHRINRPMDLISSLSSGMTFTLKQLLGLSVVIISYSWMESWIGVFNINPRWWVFLLAFIGLDFAGYWQHRFNHTFNILWNRHIIHHSSEEFNLSCALRQNISVIFQVYFFLYIPMAVIGIPTEVIATVAPVHFFAQFWYHTKLINKMGFLEYIIVTPSHHRVHHAINDEYIDKNFAEIFIIWDKMFGTFQEELASVPPVYGIKKPARTWNPALINFMHLWQLIKDAWLTNDWKAKLTIWMKPTGWRPADLAEKYPLKIIEEPYQYQKYQTSYSKLLLSWVVFQFVLANILQYYLLVNIASFDYLLLVSFSLFLFAMIFTYTSLMDGHWLSLVGEFVKIGLAIFILFRISDLPHVSTYKLSTVLQIGLGIYLLVSLIISVFSFLGNRTWSPKILNDF